MKNVPAVCGDKHKPEWKLKTLVRSVIFYRSENVFFSTVTETPNVKY